MVLNQGPVSASDSGYIIFLQAGGKGEAFLALPPSFWAKQFGVSGTVWCAALTIKGWGKQFGVPFFSLQIRRIGTAKPARQFENVLPILE